MKPLRINPAFQNLIPPLSDDELQGLEESILHQGCRDNLKVWKGAIIDGHNRYAICTKHDIPYNVQELRFASKKDAELWIIQNQLGRRNLTTAIRIKLVLRKESLLREKAKKNRKGAVKTPIHSRKIMANEIGVSERVVYQYMRICKLGVPELVRQVDAGEVKIGTAYRRINNTADVKQMPLTTELPTHESPLEVTTRTVEVFHGTGSPDISNLHYRAGVLRNIRKIADMFRFVYDNATILRCGEVIHRIEGRVRTQSKAVCMLAD